MTAVLLDTPARAWHLDGAARLSPHPLTSIRTADTVLVTPISFFEIARKVRLGKWPWMAAFVDQLPALLDAQGGVVAGFKPVICLLAGMMDWSHRDPFDRLLAATARHHALPLLLADSVFDGIVTRIWLRR